MFYKKNVGSGVLRDPARVDEILAAIRATVDVNVEAAFRRFGTPNVAATPPAQFTVKGAKLPRFR